MSLFSTFGKTCILFVLLNFYSHFAFCQAEQSVWISLTDPDDNYNETLISFNASATDTTDVHYDTYREAPPGFDIYSKIGIDDFKAQTLAALTSDKTVTLGIDAAVSGYYRLNREQLVNIDASIVIILEDTLTGVMQNLNAEPNYIFEQTADSNIQRLRLHFYPPFSFTSTSITCAGNPGAVHLSQAGTHTWSYELTDEHNIMIDSGSLFCGAKTVSDLSEGIYTIDLTDDYGYQITKQVVLDGKEPVVAQFEVSEEEVQIGEAFHFYDYSIGASNHTWNFGDGTVITGDAFPIHQFTLPGTYQIVLTASNADCQQTFSKTVEVSDVANGIGNTLLEEVRFYSDHYNLVLSVPNTLEAVHVKVYNLLGQNVLTENSVSPGQHNISLAGKCQFCIVEVTSAEAMIARGQVFIK